MSATSGGGSVSDGSEAGESSQSTMSVSDSPSTSFQAKHSDNVTKITLSEDSPGFDLTGSKINLTYDDRQQSDGVVNMAFDYEEGMGRSSGGGMSMSMSSESGGRAGSGMSSGMGGGAAGGGMSGGMSAGSAGGMGGGSAGGMSAGSAGGMGGGSAGGMSGTGGGISGSMAGGIAGGISGGIAGGTAAGMAGGMSGGVAGGQGSGMSGGMGSGGASAGGAEKKDKVPEAVNLELVNMVPYSNGNGTSYGVPVNGIPGIPVKKDSEQADMSTPYDEYFVPVNEHKKYMRGEKLYVTKDKRRPTSWRRCLSWIVACTVISVVLIVAILAGTGVILSDDQNGVKEASVGRNFAGASFRPGVTSKQTNGSNMYVPRSIESELIVDNLDLDPALLDSNSSAYQQFAKNMEEKLKMILFDKEILESAASDIGLRVVNVSRDPFKVNYRIGWNYKDGSSNSVEPIKMEEVKQKLIESLSRNQGYIDKYHIDGENIKVDHVVNECQMNNGGCSHICYYNYITQLFTCTCPTHLVLDDSRKNCVEWTGSSEQDFLLVPDRNSHPSVDMNFQQNVHYDLGNEKDGSSESLPGGEDEAHEIMHHGGHHQHDHGHEYHHDVNNQRPGGEPEAEPTPEPAPEPAPEPGTTSEDSDSSSKSKSDNKNWSHSGVYVHGDSGEDEPVAEPSPEPTSDTDSEDGHHSKDHEPSAEPNPEPNSDSFDHSSKNDQNGGTEHSSKDQSKTELGSSKDHESNSQSGMDHGGYYNMDHHFMVPGVGFASTGDHEPSAEPTPEPGSDNKDNTHDSHTGFGYINSGEHGESQEPSAEPTPEPGSDSKDDSHTHDSHTGFGSISSGEHGESQEPSAEPTPEPGSDTKDNTHDSQTGFGSINSGEHEGSHEPSAEPTPEPGSDTKDDSHTHDSHTGFGFINSGEQEGSHKPSAEPTPGSDSDSKDNTHDSHTGFGSINSGEHEGSHEPSAEPTPGSDSDTKDNSHDSHTGFGFINSGEHEGSQEPSAEPTPEPSPDTKDHTHDSHTGFGHTDSDHGKSQEPSAEPTPEPGTDSSDHEKSHPGVYNHQESIDSSTEQNPNSRNPGDSSSTMQIHGGTDGLTSDPNQSTNSNDNVHTSIVTDNEHKKGEESVAEPTPQPGSADQDHHEQMHSNADREPSDDLKRIQETDPETISHLFTAGGSRPNDESQNEQPNSTGSSTLVGREEVEGSVGSTQKPGVDSTSGHETTTPHIETQPGHEGQITEGRQNDPMTHSQPGVSVIQTQNTNPETTTDSNANEKESQTVGFVGEKDKEQPVDGVHSMTHVNMKPDEVEGKTATESVVEFKHPEQTSESQMGVQTQTFSGQTPENEKQGPETGVYVNNERGGSNTESTPEHATEPKEHETSNKSEQKPDDQSDKVVTDSFHKYILGQDGNLKPQSKEGEVAPKGSGDESTMTTAKPDISAGRETDSSQTPTTLSPHISMGSGPVGVTGSVLEQILLNDSISHPVHGVHERTDAQSKTNSEPTDHHVPSFQDILIKESSPSTIFNHPEGQNVSDSEAKNDNTPVIETVIFDKSSPQSSDSHTPHGTMSDDDKKSETGKSETGETENVTSGSNNAETDKNAKESSTAQPGIVSAKDSLSGVTINPTVVEYVASSDSQNNGEKKEDEMKTAEGIKGLGVTEPSGVTESKGYEVTELTSDSEPPTEHPKLHFGLAGTTQQPSSNLKTSEEEQSSSVSESDSKKPTDEFEKSKTASVNGDETAKTTLRPEYNRERATIPVTIIAGDFPSPYDGSSSEIFQRNPLRGTAEGRITGSSDENSQKSKSSSENSPKESTTDLYQTGGSGSKTPQSESTDQETVPGVHGSDVTGTTKNPDDFSNNIKDENEDFNALIEQETVPGEGKEILLSKFSNKFSKPDKKKIKDFDKKFGDGTTKSGITPEEYSLQKHTKGNENGFDLDYSFPREQTTVPDVISHGVPGVSFNEHGINNHDISILQTVTPDLKTETVVSGDIRSKSPDSKEVDKDYSKFDKDYKYKEKGGKKKDLKKKIGGKDGKNVELDDSRKYFTDSMEEGKDFSDSTQTPTFERVGPIVFNNKDYEGLLPREESEEVTTGGSGSHLSKGFGGTTITQTDGGRGEGLQQGGEYYIRGGQITNGGASVTNATSPGTVYDGQFHTFTTFRNPNQSSQNQTVTYVPGTIFDGVSHRTIPSTTFTQRFENGNGGQYNTTYVVYETTLPNGTVVITNTSSTAHPTIIVRGQSGSLQDGHTIKSFDFGNGSFGFPENYQFKFSNGSTVHPTIVIRGQSGALQDGHESRFVNGSFGGANGNYFGGGRVVTNSTVYRIENGSLPGTVFDGHFNPQEGHYHMFTNASGTFVYTNATSQPTFVIKGSSGDFGNSKGYILGNQTRTVLNHTFPSTWFSNATGFAQGIHEVLTRPQNETIKYTHQITPTTFSSSYDSSVNNYFGYISKCAAGQFQCINGTSKRGSACISLSSKCDSINDCSDGSDELGCIESGCPGNFQCSDGSCLKRHLVCNGIVDCSDGSDEQKCESWKCEFDEFQCPSGRCIPVVWQCDNKPDCDNHTDEYNCQTSCGNDEYLCPEGWCIPLTYKCNGVKECSNGEDEQLCDCSLDEFKCHTGGCVSKTSVCNGLDDCPDRSDEWGCVQLEPETNLIKIRTAAGSYEPICADGWTTQHSDEVCASLGYSSSIPLEVDNSASSITNEKSFFILKSNRTEHFSKKLLVNLMRSNDTCSSGKLVEITCQEFSCGSRSMTDSSVEARLVGGKTATAGQWPSVALLYNVRNLHSCTANVLTPRWVLASYNCLKMGNKNLNQQDWKMFGGSTVFETEKETAETRNIVSIVPHPQVKFNQFLFSNDLALVELDEPLYFTSSMGAVCLPEQEIQPRQICVTAGWGMNAPDDKVIRQQLQYLPVPTMNLTECNSTEHYSGFITEDKICAGYNAAEKSLCYNEEGAPLMCVNDRGEWELQGVLSYHSNCGRGSHPSIFSSITPAKEWIKQTIGNSFERKVIPVTKR